MKKIHNKSSGGILKKILKRIVPKRLRLPLIFWWLKRANKLDPEMFVASNLCKNKRIAIDVGSNNGLYSYFYSKNFESVKSFEPFPMASQNLIQSKLKNVEFFHYALSSTSGDATLHAPVADNGRVIHSQASLNQFSENSIQVAVSLRTLDSFEFQDVNMLKVDVEGHERNVLEGAVKTIRRCKPIILVEIEERHLGFSPENTIDFIEKLGYASFIFVENKLTKTSDFDYLGNQRNCVRQNNFDSYCNNFIFVPVK